MTLENVRPDSVRPLSACFMSSEADPHKFHPSISVNPREYFGLWTPQGWKTHRMRRLATRSESVTASGDGMATVFSGFAENACAVV